MWSHKVRLTQGELPDTLGNIIAIFSPVYVLPLVRLPQDRKKERHVLRTAIGDLLVSRLSYGTNSLWICIEIYVEIGLNQLGALGGGLSGE